MLKPNQHVLDYIDDYLHGALSASDAQVVERHCATCRICKTAMEEAEKRFEAMKTIPATEAPERLIRQTVENVTACIQRRRKFRKHFGGAVLLATAVSVLIIGVANIYYYRLAPSPCDLRILGQHDLLADTGASLRVAMLNHETGEPMAGVPVEIAVYDKSAQDWLHLASFETDSRGAGSPRLTMPDWDDGQYRLRVTAQPGGPPEVLTQTIELRREWKLMLSSDKPVYQPGQTIRVRSLALRRPDLKPVAGREVIFTITDPKGNVIFKQKEVTSKFGISSADCPLATEIIEGPYQIECRAGETTSRTTVEVKKYVLPKFKVAVTLDQPYYKPGSQVSGTVRADYFFGKPVAGGDVQIEVRGIDVESFEICSISKKTDTGGKAEFTFILPDRLAGRDQDAGDARFMLVATVTDSAGQKGSKGASRTVTVHPIQLEIIPESGALVRGLPNRIYVFATYADGRPAQVRLAMLDADAEVETNKLGVASFEITPREDPLYLTVKATDDEGREGRKQVQLTCGRLSGHFIVRTDKAVYDGGDTMSVMTLGGGVEPVFLDFIKDGQTILTQSIEMKNGLGRFEFDLPPDMFGTIELCAYRFDTSGLAVRQSRMIYVSQARALKIKATFDKDEYRPGGRAKLKLALTDDEGTPAPGAISLAAVDEAVFSVLSQQAGMEQTFFLLEQELLEPLYTIYPGWSPELFSELPIGQRMEFEQALFSRTARTLSGRNALPGAFAGRDLVRSMRRGRYVGMEPRPDRVPRAQSGSPFTLADASFLQKWRAVNARRQSGLIGVATAWFSLFGVLAILGAVSFAVSKPKAFLITLGVAFSIFWGLVVLLIVFAILISLGCSAAPREPQAVAESCGAKMAADKPSDKPPAVHSLLEDAYAPPRVRQWFPETLLWRPELVTDDDGVAELEIDLADSITTWRLSTSAVSGEGQLGGQEFLIRVFQSFFVDFNLPVALTRNDEVGVPVVVYNYLDKPQTVELELKDAEWFERLDTDENQEAGTKTIELKPGEVRSLNYPLKVLKVGKHTLEVTARGSGIADAIRREIEVVPDGRRVEEVASGTLSQPAEMTLSVPQDAIEGSTRAIVKLYPSSFSQLVEGLDAIFRMPGGCFEQTSSTTYPNVLALDYLRRTNKSVPQVEAKARQYIHTGYQRLVSFEVAAGGFDWFGRPPANRTLTAYGLMEFEDMAKVYDVDPRLVERTRQWLLAQRKGDGSWANESGMLNDGLAGNVNRGGDLDLAATAYIAWAVFGNGSGRNEAGPTLGYLLAHRPESINDPYLLAITAMAIAGIDPNRGRLGSYLARLDEMKKTSDDGKQVWWEQPAGSQTTFYGSGRSGDIVTTATATLALLEAGRYPATARGALTWLVEQKDPNGTWHSTQATVLSLKALLAGTGAPLGGEKERKIDIALNDEIARQVVIPVDQSEVMQQIDLSNMLTAGNEYRLTLTDQTDTAVGYQVTFRYHVEGEAPEPVEKEALSIDIEYDRQRLNVDDTVTAVATVTNNMSEPAPMVIVDLPIPGGFAIDPGELDELVGSQKIARYQITARQAIVYLRQLSPGEKLALRYRLRATMPVKVAVPDARVYEYYDPDKKASGGAVQLEATIRI